MSSKLPGGSIYNYGLFHGQNQIGFLCFANYTARRKGQKIIYHTNRLVVHPDYAGLGLGIKFMNACSAHFMTKYKQRVMTKFSSIPVYKALIKSKEWRYLGTKRKLDRMKSGSDRKSGFREYGVTTYHFEFIGNE